MLIEDNVDDIFITRRILRKAGVDEVRVAANGQEALDLLLSTGEPLPELLILDLRLPLISGIKILTELRRQERTMSLPVLILTSSEDPKDRDTCRKLGVMAYLYKPLELGDILQLFS